MPVEKSIGTPPRQIVFLVISLVIGIGSMIFVFTRIGQQADLAQLQADLGPSAVPFGPAEEMANGIDESGPFLLSDPSGNDRDIYLQHVGPDPLTGWHAFGVRPSASPRECVAEWQTTAREFVDNCDGATYPETGEGLPNYVVTVDGDGNLSVDLG